MDDGGKKKLFFVVTEDWYFYSHRLPMARAAQRAGFDVSVLTNVDQHQALIEAENIRVIPFSMDRRSLNPLRAVGKINELRKIYQQEKPDLVHHIAMKPVLYGAIASWLAGVPRVLNAFAGLGYLFCGQDAKAKLLKFLLLPFFRFFLKREGRWLLLQNNDDLALLQSYKVTPDNKTVVIKGSGVDLDDYAVIAPEKPAPDFICAFAGRMIEIKGLPTLQKAFEMLETSAPHVKLWLCGTPDPANPGAWTEERLQAWGARPNIEYKGHCSNMPEIWQKSHCAVQASYGGEGVPKSLLEAASCGRAIVTTLSPGCREMVAEGINGYAVPIRDAQALAAAIENIAQDFDVCAQMGRASRALVEKEFSAAVVSQKTEALYRRIADA
jgi:glycosyltransferase involved in cell wall biosynthesis